MKLSTFLISAFTCVTLAACGNAQSKDQAVPGASVPGTAYGQISKGSPDAKAVIVEYASATCPGCAVLHEEVIKKLEPRMAAGDLRLEYNEFLTSPANVAHASFKIARCAGEDKYFDVLEDIYKNQRGIVIASQQRQLAPALYAVAQRHGLSKAEFETCLMDQKVHDAIRDNWKKGQDRGVSSTPTMYFNGKALDRSLYYDLDKLNEMIDQANGITRSDEPVADPTDVSDDVPVDVKIDDAATDTPKAE